ncbi:hypothetical protein HY642_03255 [Candidatus Woesearchaeota archaeon]|nr:hypothetical protein [Candidatus Woesearchaeota archaeon]
MRSGESVRIIAEGNGAETVVEQMGLYLGQHDEGKPLEYFCQAGFSLR